MKKKQIIIVNTFPIYPPTHGGQVRIYNIYKNLSEFFVVKLICFGENTEFIEKKEIFPDFTQITINKTNKQRYYEIILGKLIGMSIDDIISIFLWQDNKSFKETIEKELNRSHAVISCHPYLFGSIVDSKILKIYEAQDVEYLLKKEIFETKNKLSLPIQKFLLHKIFEIEKEAVLKSDIVTVVSHENMEYLKELFHEKKDKFIEVANGVTVNPMKSENHKKALKEKLHLENRKILLFIGSGHPPNVEALKSIFELADRLHEYLFFIVGSVGIPYQNKNERKNVKVFGIVSDEIKEKLFEISDIALNPMKHGSGTNIKMLDYMASGIPVISTPIGARGLDLQNGRDAIICNLEDFEKSIRDLIKDKELYKKLLKNGRQLIQEKYDWKKISDNYYHEIESNL